MPGRFSSGSGGGGRWGFAWAVRGRQRSLGGGGGDRGGSRGWALGTASQAVMMAACQSSLLTLLTLRRSRMYRGAMRSGREAAVRVRVPAQVDMREGGEPSQVADPSRLSLARARARVPLTQGPN